MLYKDGLKKETAQSFIALTSRFSVELPGIEPGPEIALTCGNAESEYQKRRESTRKYLGRRDRC